MKKMITRKAVDSEKQLKLNVVKTNVKAGGRIPSHIGKRIESAFSKSFCYKIFGGK